MQYNRARMDFPGEMASRLRTARGVSEALSGHAEALCRTFLPGGRRDGNRWRAGGLEGGRGDGITVRLDTGRWHDAGTGFRGDLLDLVRRTSGMPTIGEAMNEARRWLRTAANDDADVRVGADRAEPARAAGSPDRPGRVSLPVGGLSPTWPPEPPVQAQGPAVAEAAADGIGRAAAADGRRRDEGRGRARTGAAQGRPAPAAEPRIGARELSERLADRAEELCRTYLPGGRRNGGILAGGRRPGRAGAVPLHAAHRPGTGAAGPTRRPASTATRST